MAQQPVTFDDKSFKKFLHFVEKKEQKFVMAVTLSQIAKSARIMLQKEAKNNWNIRRSAVLNGFKIIGATKRNLESFVGHIDWYAVDQLSDVDSIRSPHKSKWMYKPLAGIKKSSTGKRTPYTPRQALRLAHKARKKRTKRKLKAKPFFIDTPYGKVIAMRQSSSKKPLTFLYKMERKQRIMPKISMSKITTEAAKKGQAIFNKNIDKALKPFR